ncbi:MAG: A/G-specific adenine glycosylase [Flammeovirgaceae bacterium]
MEKNGFAAKLLDWYQIHKRDLPWRHSSDPYKIWLSEIILQQTRVQQGLPYYERFVENYPTVQDLAMAEEQEVLRLWQGLGYYSRARNMHYAAKTIATELGGKFPNTYKEILKLKGVGGYTAAAIASFAFGEPVAVVDGNVFRVLARLFNIDDDIASSTGKKVFEKLANELIPHEHAGEYNQAIMEFGALHCTPKKPNCLFCPFQQDCEAFRLGKQAELPVKINKTKVRKRYFHYLVWEHEGELLVKERQAGDVWQGLHDFMLIEHAEKFLETEEVLARLEALTIKSDGWKLEEISKDYKHILSHQRIHARFFHVKLNDVELLRILAKQKAMKIANADRIQQLPKPKLIVNYLKDAKI